ncbi:MAG: hypothetical protein KAI74_03800, partial [Kiritimatiellae bacterium]|nr:hypothetical protein [Kiritimatiellia bacterium]
MMKNMKCVVMVISLFVFVGSSAFGQTTYTVGASGADYTTIVAAEAACVDGDTIEIIDAVHTESNITVDVNITIKGQGADQTTVQAAATRGTAGEEIFYIPNIGTPVVTFQDMTLKHGDAS